MDDTRWVERAWLAPEAPNRIGLVTTARDLERLGRLILANGEWKGRALVNAELLRESLRPSQSLNPSYGLLWWLNGQERFLTRFPGIGGQGPHFPTAPMDAVLGLGALDRHLMLAPSQDLVVVRLGDAVDLRRPVAGARFTRVFWKLLARAGPDRG
jgi:CubicO group peptidase (beta-lactamase class C family)